MVEVALNRKSPSSLAPFIAGSAHRFVQHNRTIYVATSPLTCKSISKEEEGQVGWGGERTPEICVLYQMRWYEVCV